MKRTSTYIATIPMKNVEQVIEVKKTLEQIFGWVVLRGRHSDRKKVLGDRYYRGSQNDIPWRKAQRIDIYLHPKNPNYQSAGQGKGIQRKNLNKRKLFSEPLNIMGIVIGIVTNLFLPKKAKLCEKTSSVNTLTKS